MRPFAAPPPYGGLLLVAAAAVGSAPVSGAVARLRSGPAGSDGSDLRLSQEIRAFGRRYPVTRFDWDRWEQAAQVVDLDGAIRKLPVFLDRFDWIASEKSIVHQKGYRTSDNLSMLDPVEMHAQSKGPGEAAASMALQVGDVVLVGRAAKERGVVKYIGTTSFKEGDWVGIELENPVGKNDGSVGAERYFDCEANHGMFVRQGSVVKESPEVTVGEALASQQAGHRRSSCSSGEIRCAVRDFDGRPLSYDDLAEALEEARGEAAGLAELLGRARESERQLRAQLLELQAKLVKAVCGAGAAGAGRLRGHHGGRAGEAVGLGARSQAAAGGAARLPGGRLAERTGGRRRFQLRVLPQLASSRTFYHTSSRIFLR
ncbi:unnamed protein product [Prorocentrum cordatum]|uniref:CAP-Gly domain-containing protein n=1 Tax=Prorocentrum cordatum TaxID=2364126 RepID=A0ABN9XPE9_9DINO|nr:unnamed protein product [Polarella glacialis]